MNSDEKIEVLKAREYTVAKSNQLVQKTRYNFSVQEQRTVAYICSKIKPIEAIDRAKGTPFQLDYDFNILEYSRVCGIQDNGRVYEECKAILKGLRDKSMWMTLEDGSETVVGWLDRVTTNKRSGIAKIKIDDRLAPYLFDLKEKFLSYGLKNILNMKSQYSIRLYELLKSYCDMKVGQTDHRDKIDKLREPKSISWTVEVEELKRLLMVENIKSYSNFNLFKTKVLEVAQKEINELTDMVVYFEPITKGRKVVKLKINISEKRPLEKYASALENDSRFEKLPEPKPEKIIEKERETEILTTADGEKIEVDKELYKKIIEEQINRLKKQFENLEK